jgi:S1-C subfamily serine protease/peptidoglycan hydrolase-like protein with peptidoglycan-binding domain
MDFRLRVLSCVLLASLGFGVTSARAQIAACVVQDPEPPLNVRSEPNGDILGRLDNGTAVLQLGASASDARWVQIAARDGGGLKAIGFVLGRYLDCSTGQKSAMPGMSIQGGVTDQPLQQLACPDLWTLRNSMFKAVGFCFQSERAINTFGNQGCQHSQPAKLDFSESQRTSLADIEAAERTKGCSKAPEVATASPAETAPPEAQHRNIAALQDALIWTGHYDALADGALGQRSQAAFSAFQRQLGVPVTGELSPEQTLRLLQLADENRRRYGFRLINDARIGGVIALPTASVKWQSNGTNGSNYSSRDGSLKVSTWQFPATGRAMSDMFESVQTIDSLSTVTLRVLRRKADAFFVAGETVTRDFYYTARLDGSVIRGYRLSADKQRRAEFAHLTVAMASAFHYGMPDYAALVGPVAGNAPTDRAVPQVLPPRQTSSLWSHNGSVLELQADGSKRVFRYKGPRPGMRDQGVEAGTILFAGQRIGDSYSGTAFIFSQRCGAKSYTVSGQISDDQRRFTLVGEAPTGLDGTCTATGTRTDRLDFELIESGNRAIADSASSKPFAETEDEGTNVVQEFEKENPGFSALSSIVMEILPTVVKAHPAASMKQKLQIAFDQAKRISQSKGKAEPEPSVSTGTGFFVSSEGHVLTNAHVVKGCTTAQVAQPGGKSEAARIVATDATNDLALLSVKWRPASVPNLKSGVRTGEGVATYGFPHVGMLPSTGNFTLGNVTATAGLGDDTRMLQISAPVQSGNSGGPLIDQSGNVIGVVVSKLNVLKAFKETGDLPQNVNFAIKASVARTFLESNGITDATPKPSAAALSAPDLADAAKQFTVFIACTN